MSIQSPIDVLEPMVRDCARKMGETVDEQSIAFARAYCIEMVPVDPAVAQLAKEFDDMVEAYRAHIHYVFSCTDEPKEPTNG